MIIVHDKKQDFLRGFMYGQVGFAVVSLTLNKIEITQFVDHLNITVIISTCLPVIHGSRYNTFVRLWVKNLDFGLDVL